MTRYIVKATKGDQTLYEGLRGTTPWRDEAFPYNNRQAAQNAMLRMRGAGGAFWEPERKAAKLSAERWKGWDLEILEI